MPIRSQPGRSAHAAHQASHRSTDRFAVYEAKKSGERYLAANQDLSQGSAPRFRVGDLSAVPPGSVSHSRRVAGDRSWCVPVPDRSFWVGATRNLLALQFELNVVPAPSRQGLPLLPGLNPDSAKGAN